MNRWYVRLLLIWCCCWCYRLNAQASYSVFWIISPKNSAIVSGGTAPVRFEWTAPWMADYQDFEIRITEIMSGQTAAGALSSNPPLVMQRTAGMDVETSGLPPGRRYAWQVRYIHSSDSSKDIFSDRLEFALK
jgi:hypothetical protein